MSQQDQSIKQYLFIGTVDRMQPQTIKVCKNRMSAKICSVVVFKKHSD